MGTILKTKLSRNILASNDGPVKKSMTPFIIQLAFVSPGCTRDVMTTPLRFCKACGSHEKDVMVSKSQLINVTHISWAYLLPANVWQSVRLRTSLLFTGSFSKLVKYLNCYTIVTRTVANWYTYRGSNRKNNAYHLHWKRRTMWPCKSSHFFAWYCSGNSKYQNHLVPNLYSCAWHCVRNRPMVSYHHWINCLVSSNW